MESKVILDLSSPDILFFLLFQGRKDTIVPLGHSTALIKLLTEVGVPPGELRAYGDLSHLKALICLISAAPGPVPR